MRIAIVHPWFLSRGGAEHTVNVLAEAFPEADIHTLLYEDRYLPEAVRGKKVFSLNTGWIPQKYRLYRYLMPLYPIAFEALDLRGYDVVITSDSCVAKGVLIDQNTVHICYCHSPMRSLYDQYRQFHEEFPALARPIFRLTAHYLRVWDFVAAQRVDVLLANSRNIAQRIQKYYGKPSQVVYPPVETSIGYIDPNPEDYYLSVGRLTPTKRNDLLIDACNRLGRRLIIVGGGRDAERLKKLAGKTVELAGMVDSATLKNLYARCRALLFAADEDFGIVPVEAQSYGRPVVAYGRGGSLETVIPGKTGVHFYEQTGESCAEAILRFETCEGDFSPAVIQAHARQFDAEIFKRSMRDVVLQAVNEHTESPVAPAATTGVLTR